MGFKDVAAKTKVEGRERGDDHDERTEGEEEEEAFIGTLNRIEGLDPRSS